MRAVTELLIEVPIGLLRGAANRDCHDVKQRGASLKRHYKPILYQQQSP
jgi:hypothetical protein